MIARPRITRRLAMATVAQPKRKALALALESPAGKVVDVESPERAVLGAHRPTRLVTRLPVEQAFARSSLHLNWSTPDRGYDLADRQQRARVYGSTIERTNSTAA
jgi:hypothetical protein